MRIDQHWYRASFTWLTLLLLPLSLLFRCIVRVRRFAYRVGIKKTHRFNVPVIVVGNITTGGTGKTPFVMWLVEWLQKQGFRPGIVSRGVGGKQSHAPRWVNQHVDPADVGDEAILLAKRTQCPVVVGIDRVAAVKTLLAQSDCNIIVSDDGLQHYRLGRDMEIVLVDGERRFGNQQCLPAGPLREPIARLQDVDFVIAQGTAFPSEYLMTLEDQDLISLKDGTRQSLGSLKNMPVHGVVAIGNPERFILSLEAAGLNVLPHTFRDHYLYQKKDIYFNDALPVVMTEKDAVKCDGFADERHWYLPVRVKMDEMFEKKLRECSFIIGGIPCAD